MGGEMRMVVGIGLVTAVIIGGAVVLFSGGGGGGGEVVAVGELVREDSWTKGDENAKVTVVEFSDLECGACAYFNLELKGQLFEKYAGDLRLGYRHFPIPGHKYSQLAAEAVEAAGAQGKFWEAVEWVFGHQGEMFESESGYKSKVGEMAGELGLDRERFEKDLSEGKYREKVLADLAEGRRLGVNSTPTLYINGVKYGGRLGMAELDRRVGEALESEEQKGESKE